jgi:hypothetical protein
MTSANNVSHQGITAAGLSEADQNINNTTEDISHKASGHKANLSNPSKSQNHTSMTEYSYHMPDTSEESKKKSAQALKELGGEDAFYGKQGKGE